VKSPVAVWRGLGRAAGFAVGAALVMAVGGCATTAQTDSRLERAARAVPVPAGLTYTDVNKQSMSTGLSETLEVDVGYSSAMSCSQLQQAWLAVLAKHHFSITSNEVDGVTRQIDVHGLGANVSIDLGLIGDCSQPYISAQNH